MNKKAMIYLEFDLIKDILKEYTLSHLGEKRIEALEPITDKTVIENWIKETTEGVQLLSGGSSAPLHALTGIERVMEKLGKVSALSIEDIITIYDLLIEGNRMKQYMKGRMETAPCLSSYALSISELPQLTTEIEKSIQHGKVSDKATSTLAKIRKNIKIIDEKIKTKLENILKSSEIKKYLQENLISTRDGRYVIPVQAQYKSKVKGTVLDSSATGSTVFIEPESIRKHCGELSLLKIQEEKEIYKILSDLTLLIETYQREIAVNIEVMVQYDFVFAKAKYSRAIEGVPVKLNNKSYIKIVEGKHPLIGKTAVALDFVIGEAYKALVITGPNTGGKTVVLKTVGLLTLMVQSGLHVPVKENSEFAIFDDVLVDIGDGQSIEQSLSTFSSHIENIKEILTQATNNTLVIVDELGAGTDPGEGMGLATSILENLMEKKATILATTHYNGIKEFAAKKEGFENGAMGFDILSLKPLYKLKIGKSGESNAFLIALRLGLDRSIIERAHEITYGEKKLYSMKLVEEMAEGQKTNVFVSKEKKRVETLNKKENKQEKSEKKRSFHIGDCVLISFLGKTGIVCQEENSVGEVGVLYQGKKIKVNRKRLSLYVEAEALYPEDYDMNILFESKENRKKQHKMSKGYVPGLVIEYDKKE
ncbi:endonuclease MutS2 [Clostridium formicaceticum]|uniref:Endonuclease MutS2 n=1 Tax=Clostridium formicaceticum TaxID=1497 RepID=A0AAC9RKG8_9CLOT|nr:hypothetical protein [Clostridium formicaceticum]AOY74539.1 hypothetical protein BJL90_00365 [Clostridium formicaceticum]ARE88896.1 Endonuclease MutS2 [Clostridium formicaceticum]